MRKVEFRKALIVTSALSLVVRNSKMNAVIVVKLGGGGRIVGNRLFMLLPSMKKNHLSSDVRHTKRSKRLNNNCVPCKTYRTSV